MAEILDGAGFACLEVSGGGVFDATVRRRVESPWERIRAIKARVSTPLGIALRGRFLVGSRPVSGDIVGRFVSCAAENGIDVFRLHDPLNDVSNLREAGSAITSAGGAFHAGLVYSPGRTGETDTLVEEARKLPELGATRILVNDPTGALVPHRAQELVARIREASGLPVGFYVQGSAGVGLASALAAVDAGADLIATTVYPLALTLHRVSGESVAESLQGLGHATGIDVDKLWEAADVIDEWIGDEPVAPVAPRIAVRAAEYDLPAGLGRRARRPPARARGGRPPARGARGGRTRPRRGGLAAAGGADRADPRLAGASARPRGTPVRLGHRRVPRARPGRLRRHARAGRPDRRARGRAARAACAPRRRTRSTTEDVREQAEGLAASEEELVLIAMFGSDAEELLRSSARATPATRALVAEDADAERGERIRELVKIVQESGVGEIEIEDDGMRVSVRRADEPVRGRSRCPSRRRRARASQAWARPAATDGITRVESPMVGVFYRAPTPGRPRSWTSATRSSRARCSASSRP